MQGPGQSLFSREADSLQPVMVQVNAAADDAFLALVRYASGPVTALSGARWTARRESDQHAMVLMLTEGPLAYLRLHCAVQPIESYDERTTVFWITGEYAARPSRTNDALEPLRAHQDARILRDEVIGMLRALDQHGNALSGHAARRSERHDIGAPARLFVANRAWASEVQNVSDSGMCLLASTYAIAVHADRRMLLDRSMGEIEVTVGPDRHRSRVLVRYAEARSAGVLVGLEVLEQATTRPLLQLALLRQSADVSLADV